MPCTRTGLLTVAFLLLFAPLFALPQPAVLNTEELLLRTDLPREVEIGAFWVNWAGTLHSVQTLWSDQPRVQLGIEGSPELVEALRETLLWLGFVLSTEKDAPLLQGEVRVLDKKWVLLSLEFEGKHWDNRTALFPLATFSQELRQALTTFLGSFQQPVPRLVLFSPGSLSFSGGFVLQRTPEWGLLLSENGTLQLLSDDRSQDLSLPFQPVVGLVRAANTFSFRVPAFSDLHEVILDGEKHQLPLSLQLPGGVHILEFQGQSYPFYLDRDMEWASFSAPTPQAVEIRSTLPFFPEATLCILQNSAPIQQLAMRQSVNLSLLPGEYNLQLQHPSFLRLEEKFEVVSGANPPIQVHPEGIPGKKYRSFSFSPEYRSFLLGNGALALRSKDGKTQLLYITGLSEPPMPLDLEADFLTERVIASRLACYALDGTLFFQGQVPIVDVQECGEWVLVFLSDGTLHAFRGSPPRLSWTRFVGFLPVDCQSVGSHLGCLDLYNRFFFLDFSLGFRELFSTRLSSDVRGIREVKEQQGKWAISFLGSDIELVYSEAFRNWVRQPFSGQIPLASSNQEGFVLRNGEFLAFHEKPLAASRNENWLAIMYNGTVEVFFP
ncbi:MAG TPA: hypothetical protein P5560_01755 [Thermotogota bacterium]|nr:hypothetical protein [Thermotogota bacterium]HRW91653.1 hypothetical protein [Thermotogota bacterium]